MIQPLISIQAAQLETPEEVSTTTSSIYSWEPDGPFENSLIMSVCPKVVKHRSNNNEVKSFLALYNLKKSVYFCYSKYKGKNFTVY